MDTNWKITSHNLLPTLSSNMEPSPEGIDPAALPEHETDVEILSL